MKYLNVNEVLDIIDERFNYKYEGKDKDDHLISKATWREYTSDFRDENVVQPEWIKGINRYRRYREDYVEKIIEYRKEFLIKQYNSNRKTTLDHEKIELAETLAEILDIKVDDAVYKRIPKTQYEKLKNQRQDNGNMVIDRKEIERLKKEFLKTIIHDLIDVEKVSYDIYQYIITGSLHYGITAPLEMIEDSSGRPIGHKQDSKNYLKDNILNKLRNKIT